MEIGRPHINKRLAVALVPDELARILAVMEGEHRLFAQILYGTGLRITQGMTLLASTSSDCSGRPTACRTGR